MEEKTVLMVFFAWIGVSSLLRMGAMAFMSLSMKVYPGFHFWTLSSLLNVIAMICFILSPNATTLLHFTGYGVSFAAMLLLPYGLKRFGKNNTDNFFTTFTLLLITFSIILYWFVPYKADIKLSIVMYSALIPSFILSIFYAHYTIPSHLTLSKNLVSLAFLSGTIFILIRLIVTSNEANLYPSSANVFTKQWLTILIDINSTFIYFGLMMLNFNRTEWDLKEAYEKVTVLGGLLPICAKCKKIRDDSGYWNNLEHYITTHSEAEFSHSFCPNCLKELYPDIADEVESTTESSNKSETEGASI